MLSCLLQGVHSSRGCHFKCFFGHFQVFSSKKIPPFQVFSSVLQYFPLAAKGEKSESEIVGLLQWCDNDVPLKVS